MSIFLCVDRGPFMPKSLTQFSAISIKMLFFGRLRLPEAAHLLAPSSARALALVQYGFNLGSRLGSRYAHQLQICRIEERRDP